jgi:hypothetical protein
VARRTRCGSAISLDRAFGLFGKAGAQQVQLFVYKRFHGNKCFWVKRMRISACQNLLIFFIISVVIEDISSSWARIRFLYVVEYSFKKGRVLL